MSRTNEPSHWYRAGATGQNVDLIGSADMTINGSPSYVSAKFGNGVDFDANTKYYEKNGSIPSTVNLTAGTFHLWISLNGYAYVNGAPNGGQNYNILCDCYDSGGTNARIWIAPAKTASGTYFSLGVVGSGYSTLLSSSSTFDVSADTLTHLAFSYDTNHATKKRVISVDGVEVDSSNTAFDVGSLTNALWTLGNQNNHNFYANAVFDNIKWCDFYKTDFSDRLNERGGLNDLTI